MLLAQDAYYEWAEAPREDLRRRVLDALGRIAEIQQHNGVPHPILLDTQ